MQWREACLISKYGVACRINEKTGRMFRRSLDGSGIVIFEGHVQDAHPSQLEGFDDWGPLL